jgi:hypothetical protein
MEAAKGRATCLRSQPRASEHGGVQHQAGAGSDPRKNQGPGTVRPACRPQAGHVSQGAGWLHEKALLHDKSPALSGLASAGL